MLEPIEKKTIDHLLLEEGVERRKIFIANMLKPDGSLPDDPKDKALILKAIDGIDKTAISRMRIKIEDKAATNQQEVARLLAHVFKGVSVTNNPFVIDVDAREVPPDQRGRVPTIPEHLKKISLVEGETAINPRQMSYNDFTSENDLPPPVQE